MKRLRGFAIVSAIFILVVLAALGAFILNVSSSQHIGSALDVQGVRAYQAARAGIEWGLYRVQESYNFGAAGANPNTRNCNSANNSFDAFGFSVTVACTPAYDPSPASGSCDPAAPGYDSEQCGPTVFRIISTACLPAGATCPNLSPSAFYIERRLEVLL